MTVIWKPALDDAATRWQTLAERLGRERFGPLAPELDRDQRYPWETIEALVEHKFAGCSCPPSGAARART
ncbi:acyl-CoA dehyrdogenase [Bordetella pertussis]|nr:acyl-CoA dehyrdogenase [Bordetella pertussis]